MKVIPLVAEALAGHNYDGLYNTDVGCSCTNDDLAPCGEWFGRCEAGVMQPCGEIGPRPQ